MLNMRVFEVMTVGTPLITTRHPDMDLYGFVEGTHYLGFAGIDEMLCNIDWVLNHSSQAEIIANNAREFVCRNHTYAHRAEELLI
jgi:spore maturation protein CgeB